MINFFKGIYGYLIKIIVFFSTLYVTYAELEIPLLSDIQSIDVKVQIGNFEAETFKMKWVLFTVICIIGLVIFIKNIYEKKISDINTKNENLEERLKSDTKDLYTKFFELLEYKDRNNIQYSIKEFMDLETYVIGVQLYTYTLKHRITFETVRPKQIMELKINHLDSVVAEQEDLNAVVQSYDRINFGLYRDLKRATQKNDIGIYQKFISDYTKRLKKQIDKRQTGKISSNDVMIFNAIILAIERYFDLVNLNKYELDKIQLTGIDTDKLYAFKRTGLLRVILNGELAADAATKEYQFFRNRKFGLDQIIATSKNNRVYVGRTFEYNKRKHLILFTLNAEIMNEENGLDKMLEIEKRLKEILSEKSIQFG